MRRGRKKTAHPNKIIIKWRNLTFGNDCVTQTTEKSHTHTHTPHFESVRLLLLKTKKHNFITSSDDL